jgi:hypothetical protein
MTQAGTETSVKGPGFPEFVALIAMMMALNALAIDSMLPALPAIGEALGVANENSRQWVVTAYLLGFGITQIVYGPLADRYGRKPVLMFGLGVYVIFSALAAFAPDVRAADRGACRHRHWCSGPPCARRIHRARPLFRPDDGPGDVAQLLGLPRHPHPGPDPGPVDPYGRAMAVDLRRAGPGRQCLYDLDRDPPAGNPVPPTTGCRSRSAVSPGPFARP